MNKLAEILVAIAEGKQMQLDGYNSNLSTKSISYIQVNIDRIRIKPHSDVTRICKAYWIHEDCTNLIGGTFEINAVFDGETNEPKEVKFL